MQVNISFCTVMLIKPEQKLFFSSIDYAEDLISKQGKLALGTLPKFTLVTGIANAKPLVEFLKERGLSFDHVEYPDHYSFKPNDIELLSKKEIIVTTEKDYVRLSDNEILEPNLFYLNSIHYLIISNTSSRSCFFLRAKKILTYCKSHSSSLSHYFFFVPIISLAFLINLLILLSKFSISDFSQNINAFALNRCNSKNKLFLFNTFPSFN